MGITLFIISLIVGFTSICIFYIDKELIRLSNENKLLGKTVVDMGEIITKLELNRIANQFSNSNKVEG